MEPAAIANHWIPHTLSLSVGHRAVVSLDISSGGGGNVSSSYFAVEVIASRLGYIIQLIQYYTSIALGGFLCYGATSTAILQQCSFDIIPLIDDAPMTMLRRQFFAGTRPLLLAIFSVPSWPHTYETIRGVCSTIASCLAVHVQYSEAL